MATAIPVTTSSGNPITFKTPTTAPVATLAPAQASSPTSTPVTHASGVPATSPECATKPRAGPTSPVSPPVTTPPHTNHGVFARLLSSVKSVKIDNVLGALDKGTANLNAAAASLNAANTSLINFGHSIGDLIDHSAPAKAVAKKSPANSAATPGKVAATTKHTALALGSVAQNTPGGNTSALHNAAPGSTNPKVAAKTAASPAHQHMKQPVKPVKDAQTSNKSATSSPYGDVKALSSHDTHNKAVLDEQYPNPQDQDQDNEKPNIVAETRDNSIPTQDEDPRDGADDDNEQCYGTFQLDYTMVLTGGYADTQKEVEGDDDQQCSDFPQPNDNGVADDECGDLQNRADDEDEGGDENEPDDEDD